MRLGAALTPVPVAGGPPGPTSLADNARSIEGAGYDSIWVFDAVGRGFMLPDPLMALAVAATVTTDVELGTGVLQLPIRNTAEVAHRIFTLGLVAADRLLLGVGPGSTEADFDTFAVGRFEDRFARFDEQWTELRQWLSTGSSRGRDLSPWPAVAGGPTVCLAGWRGRWVERAAADGVPWVASGAYADDDTLVDAIGRYRQMGGGRAIVTNVAVADDPGATLDRLARLADAGFDDAVVVDHTPSEARLADVMARWRP